jgi:2-iminobutanoate/2-iminopropanoate deaminase
VHLADISEFDRFNRVYSQFFEGYTLPARTTVGSQLPEIKIEIDAVAYVPTTMKEFH